MNMNTDPPDLDMVVDLHTQLLRLLGVLSLRIQLEAEAILHAHTHQKRLVTTTSKGRPMQVNIRDQTCPIRVPGWMTTWAPTVQFCSVTFEPMVESSPTSTPSPTTANGPMRQRCPIYSPASIRVPLVTSPTESGDLSGRMDQRMGELCGRKRGPSSHRSACGDPEAVSQAHRFACSMNCISSDLTEEVMRHI